jgi:hypothetical protein
LDDVLELVRIVVGKSDFSKIAEAVAVSVVEVRKREDPDIALLADGKGVVSISATFWDPSQAPANFCSWSKAVAIGTHYASV